MSNKAKANKLKEQMRKYSGLNVEDPLGQACQNFIL
jgi:hypothetical protein